jgi:predicted NAD/FAD-binding protein
VTPSRRIAIVGTGVSGLTAAALLHHQHELVLFEAGRHVGGHVNTIDVSWRGEQHAIDTGFIVFNEPNYPHLVRLFERLGIESRETEMSFSVRDEASGLEFNGTDLNGLFAQRRNALRPSFLRMLRDIMRFHRVSLAWLAEEEAAGRPDDGTTVDAFIARHGLGRAFRDRYLLPIGASIWSCPAGTFAGFPVRFVLEFMRHHRMLHLGGRPTWRTVVGGSATYVRKLTAPFADRIRLETPVRSIRRTDDGVLVHTDADAPERFDEVIIAAHADEALAMLADPSPVERELLSAFPYQPNEAVLHADPAVLPRTRRAWAAWNYLVPATPGRDVNITYNMNILQGLESRHVFNVTLNDDGRIAEDRIIGRYPYAHPVYTPDRGAAQARHAEVLRADRTSFCGAYWGYGFHEDGCASGVRVAEAFGASLESPFETPGDGAPIPAAATTTPAASVP